MTDADRAQERLDPAMTDQSPIVRVAGVDKTFTTQTGEVITTALQGIDLEIRRGEFVSLIGPSGCGKSTLLRLIGDLTQPSNGTVHVNGKPAHDARLGREYGMVWLAITYGTKARSMSDEWTKMAASVTPSSAPATKPIAASRQVYAAAPTRNCARDASWLRWTGLARAPTTSHTCGSSRSLANQMSSGGRHSQPK